MLQQLIDIFNQQGQTGLMFFLASNYSGKNKEDERIKLMQVLTGQAPRRVNLVDLENQLINYVNTPKLF